MTVDQAAARWPLGVRLLHWGSVLLLGATWTLIALREGAEEQQADVLLVWHQTLGLGLLLFVLVRLGYRLSLRQQPVAPEPAPFWMARLATAVHGLLYLALLAMPVSGFCMSQSSGHAIHLFNQWNLPQWLPVDRHSKKIWHELHTDLIWLALLSLSTLHVLGVVHHVLIKRDRSLIRMW